jgi:hypothetical protein
LPRKIETVTTQLAAVLQKTHDPVGHDLVTRAVGFEDVRPAFVQPPVELGNVLTIGEDCQIVEPRTAADANFLLEHHAVLLHEIPRVVPGVTRGRRPGGPAPHAEQQHHRE